MSYTENAPDRDPDRTYGQQQTPAAGCRPAFDQAPLRQAMSTRCRIVPATLPQRGTGRTSLKTSVSICETLFLVPSSFAGAGEDARIRGRRPGTGRLPGTGR